MCFFNVILLFYSYIFMYNINKSLFLILSKSEKTVIKNQKNCFFLQPAILIFAPETEGRTDEVISLKLTDENILQLVKTIH
jgi:hypothetical protein